MFFYLFNELIKSMASRLSNPVVGPTSRLLVCIRNTTVCLGNVGGATLSN